MTDFYRFYETGMNYFREDLEIITESLLRKRCVGLCSAYKMADRLFMDFLYYHLAKDPRFELYYDEQNTFTKADLNKAQTSKTDKIKVLLLPWYHRMNPLFKKHFVEHFRSRRNTFLSVALFTAEFLDATETYFPDTNIPMNTVLTRKNFNKTQANEVLDQWEVIENKKLTKKQRDVITALSGGHFALIKRLVMLMQRNAVPTVQAALQDPTTKADLLQLEMQLRTLSQATCIRIGLVTPKKAVAIPLLKHFVDSISKDPFTDKLSLEQKRLLQLLKERNGEYVTLNECHKVLNPSKPFSMWSTYKAIARFSRQISMAYRLRNVKGKGYILTKI